jgi:hypothetical protein
VVYKKFRGQHVGQCRLRPCNCQSVSPWCMELLVSFAWHTELPVSLTLAHVHGLILYVYPSSYDFHIDHAEARGANTESFPLPHINCGICRGLQVGSHTTLSSQKYPVPIEFPSTCPVTPGIFFPVSWLIGCLIGFSKSYTKPVRHSLRQAG